MAFRIAQISDTHLSRERPFFAANFLRVAEHLRAERPDLVVNTGDLALDGPQREEDLAEARRLHEAIGQPVRSIPGNHDVGECQEAPAHPQLRPITDPLRRRYVRHFGAGYWALDVPGWRLAALDAQLLGSDLEDAGAQLRFLREAAAGAAGRRIALFVHKPLFHLSPEETAVGGRFVNPEPRKQLLDIFEGNRPALVCSGHVHQFLSSQVRETHHVWAPSTAFVLPDAQQPVYGLKEAGYVAHDLFPDGTHASRFVAVPGLETHSITDFPGAYGGIGAGNAGHP
jgi:3',5'-cyclic AMP phosphodiesterase CpdA